MTDQQGMFVKEEKVWMTPGVDVPIKRTYSVTKGIGAKQEITAVKIGEEVTAGKQKLKCVRLEGTHQVEMRDGPESTKITVWLSAEIPGGLVREDRTDEKDKSRSSQVVVEFKAIR